MNAERLLEHFERISEVPDAIPCLRQFILELAVRGKLVDHDPKDEPASELLKRILAENDWLGDMIRKIRNAQPGALIHLAEHLVNDLTQLNEYSKRFSHGEEDGSEAASIDPRESRGYVDQALTASGNKKISND